MSFSFFVFIYTVVKIIGLLLSLLKSSFVFWLTTLVASGLGLG
jgi:hypothetical protein